MNKQSIENYLSTHAFFSELDSDFIEFLSDSAAELSIQHGDVLFKQGERTDKFYLLRNGQVSVQVPALVGPTLEIQTLGEV
jgi:CRP-like cAMP-binding protein